MSNQEILLKALPIPTEIKIMFAREYPLYRLHAYELDGEILYKVSTTFEGLSYVLETKTEYLKFTHVTMIEKFKIVADGLTESLVSIRLKELI